MSANSCSSSGPSRNLVSNIVDLSREKGLHRVTGHKVVVGKWRAVLGGHTRIYEGSVDSRDADGECGV